MNSIIEQIIELSKDGSVETMTIMETLIEKELAKNPHNIELLLRFALLEQSVPFADHVKSTMILNIILAYEPKNPIATLVLAGVNHFCGPAMDDKEIYEKLTALETDDKELESMLTYAASWYYAELEDNENLERMLLKSINLYPKHVFNRWKLAELYFKQGRLEEAKFFIKKAMANVVKLFGDEEHNDYTDVNNYINEMIKGTHITPEVYIVLGELLRKIEEKLKEYN